MSNLVKITNNSGRKLVLTPSFVLSDGQSRDASESDLAAMNQVVAKALVDSGAITAEPTEEGDDVADILKSIADSGDTAKADVDAKAKADADAKAKAKADADAKAKADADAKAKADADAKAKAKADSSKMPS